MSLVMFCFIKPAQRSCWGVYWFHSVCPSRVSSAAPTVLVGTISYLHILSINFRRCVACKVLCKIWNLDFWQFFKICNFDFVLFWLGIWCEWLVWVIMGRRGVSQNEGVLVVLVFFVLWLSWSLNIKTVLSTYGDFHVKDKTAVRTSYL